MVTISFRIDRTRVSISVVSTTSPTTSPIFTRSPTWNVPAKVRARPPTMLPAMPEAPSVNSAPAKMPMPLNASVSEPGM